MKLADRVDRMEDMFTKHIEESGAIRTDLAWLKKAFWVLASAVVVAVVSQLFKPGVSHGAPNLPPVPIVGQRH